MRTRQTHRKSRLGCRRCRSKHIKCDEKSPSCSTCVQRDEICVYTRFPAKQAGTTTHSLTTPAHYEPSVNNHLPVRTLANIDELRLLHHWCTKTSLSFSPELNELCQNSLVTEALEHHYLMESLLALTAFQIACEARESNTAQKYAIIGIEHQTRAIAGLQPALDSFKADDGGLVFASSTFHMVSVFVSPFLPLGCNRTPSYSIEALLPLGSIMHGIGWILEASKVSIEQGPLGLFLRIPPDVVSYESFSPPIEQLHKMNKSTMDVSLQAVFDKAIRLLEDITRNSEPVMSWIARVEPRFTKQLRDKASLALAIFMVWGALMRVAKQIWWINFAVKNIVDQISTLLSSRSDEWKDIITWCRGKVELWPHMSPV